MGKISDWAWTVLILPVMLLFNTKADKEDVRSIQTEISRIADRVDKIYEYLMGSK